MAHDSEAAARPHEPGSGTDQNGLPNFVIIGAGKAGTSALYLWLRQHPDVYLPSELKETFFFCFDPANPDHVAQAGSRFPVTTLESYRSLFAAGRDSTARGEATPLYLDDPSVPARMRDVIPEARLLVSLREPVSRVWSHAQMNVRQGRATDLVKEADRLAATDEHEYAPKFERWFDHFPSHQFCIFRYEELSSDPDGLLRRLFAFLGVDPTFTVETNRVHNPGGIPRSTSLQRLIDLPVLRRLRPVAPMAAYNALSRLRTLNSKRPPPMPEDLRARLSARYRSDILATQALLEIDLADWVSGTGPG